MIGGAAGGLYAGITGVKCFSFCSPGLLALVAFIGPDGFTNIINACISMVIAFIVIFVLVWLYGYQDVAKQETEGKAEEVETAAEIPADHHGAEEKKKSYPLQMEISFLYLKYRIRLLQERFLEKERQFSWKVMRFTLRSMEQ